MFPVGGGGASLAGWYEGVVWVGLISSLGCHWQLLNLFLAARVLIDLQLREGLLSGDAVRERETWGLVRLSRPEPRWMSETEHGIKGDVSAGVLNGAPVPLSFETVTASKDNSISHLDSLAQLKHIHKCRALALLPSLPVSSSNHSPD